MTPRNWVVDVIVTIVAFCLGCALLMLSASSVIISDVFMQQYLGIVSVTPTAGAFIAVAITTFPLVVRRRFPWMVYLFTMITFLGLQPQFGAFSLSIVGPVVAIYTVACERTRVEAAVVAALSVVGLLVVYMLTMDGDLSIITCITNMVFVIAAALAGYAFRTRRNYIEAVEQRAEAVEQRAEEAERTREQEAARRVEEERVRIAREIHDITAHSLSAVSIQAAAAERLIDRDPEAAKEAIVTVRTTAKSALDDIRNMIGVLRQGDTAAETAPTAGTNQLSNLEAYLEKAGIEAVVDQSNYDRSRVPMHVDVALFGIAREATTNIVRHAEAQHAWITLSLQNKQAQLVVEDDGHGMTTNSAVPDVATTKTEDSNDFGLGHGIEGMTERAQLLGGTLKIRPRAGGGLRVSATLPLNGGTNDKEGDA